MENNESNFGSQNSIGDALFELKKLQDFIADASTPFLGRILGRLIETDTIPLILLTKHGIYETSGHIFNEKTNKMDSFTTSFFRIDSIERGSNCAKLTLLRPYDINKKPTNSLCDVVKLVKTSICVEVDLSCICGVQCLSTELLKRKIIIEPKW
ncbi:CotY/CotZ family spore coat protein [Bacillus sp. B15-48]|uniref:CotY/CotZ family spore coat protein n=1 Tax=Bacillus sp. B15-48 TaxID=1548601 RepID=UPI001940054E|nr:CotY/CotZ family spore coat protein [Bacillus sp. B15-48]MBM4762205.1 hypothetical protein [Bacillus sp. B15-48]